MRAFGRTLAVLSMVLAVSLVSGQQPGGFRGLGGGFGGQGAQDAVTLLNLDQVKKELGVTDAQMEKVPAAVMQALSTVLDQKQLTRLRQIELQRKGSQAFADALVQKELKFSAEQSGNVKTILEDSRKEIAEAMKDAQGGGGFGGLQEKMTSIRKETDEKIQAVLSSDQRKTFKQMLGDEFKLETKGGFGGFGKGKKKKDF
jgi:hypothetical protein